MKQLVCEMCGGTDLIKKDGLFICQSCNAKYSVEEAKKMMVEGTVRIDNSHMIANYLQMAVNAYNSSNQVEAESYANKVIEIDPLNYQALLIKGKAAGWQSTLQNPRFPECISAFTTAIQNTPEDDVEDVTEEVKTEIINLSSALVSLRADRFAQWPDQEELDGFMSDISTIFSTIMAFLDTGVIIPISDILKPIATIINTSVVSAYQNVISTEYKSDRYPYPDEDDWQKLIQRIDFSIKLLETVINLCDDDDESNIQLYENLITLQRNAIDSCSYTSTYFDYHPESGMVSAFEAAVRRDGNFPDSKNSLYWSREYCLADTAKAIRRSSIATYEAKIKTIKDAINKKEAEEAQTRFDSYWATHSDERLNLEEEQKRLKTEIDALYASLNEPIASLNKDISDIPGNAEVACLEERIKKLTEEKSSLGIFKVKEKNALQDQINLAESDKRVIQARMDSAKKDIQSKIDSIKADIQKKVSPLQHRINTINTELKKAR